MFFQQLAMKTIILLSILVALYGLEVQKSGHRVTREVTKSHFCTKSYDLVTNFLVYPKCPDHDVCPSCLLKVKLKPDLNEGCPSCCYQPVVIERRTSYPRQTCCSGYTGSQCDIKTTDDDDASTESSENSSAPDNMTIVFQEMPGDSVELEEVIKEELRKQAEEETRTNLKGSHGAKDKSQRE